MRHRRRQRQRRRLRPDQRRTAVPVLAVLLTGLILGACTPGGPTATPAPSPSPSGPDPTQAQGPTDQPISTAGTPVPCDVDGVITVGISPDYEPFVDQGPAGVQGFDIDLMNAVAEAAGLQIAYAQCGDFGSLLTDMADGRFAVAISAISQTPAREQIVDFSTPYYQTVLAVAVREGSDIQSPDQLAGRMVGVQSGTAGQDWCTQQLRDGCAAYPSIEEAFAALSENTVDAVVDDQPSASRHIGAYKGLRLLDTFIPSQQVYGIAVRKGCGGLLHAINAGLEEIRAAGTYGRLCRAWDEKVEQAFAAGCMEVPVTPPTPPAAATATPPGDVVPTPPPSCEIAEGTGAGAGQPYEVQGGDWLSRIAEREYGNPFDYRAIVALNNQKCQTNTAYTCIESADAIGKGWIIYLPTAEEVAAYWAGQGIATLPEVDCGVSGNIAIVGSQTVYPLTQRVADCFREAGFGGDIPDIGKEHTGPGIATFCAGGADIADASRPIKDEERQACQDIGLDPIAFEIGTDAIVIAVSAGSAVVGDPELDGLTLDQLRQILATAEKWSDVKSDWPDEAIQRFYPPEGSGTRDVLVNEIFDGDPTPLSQAPHVTTRSEEYEYAELATQVRDNPHAVGFFGYAYYQSHEEALGTLPVDRVQPRPETVDSGAYPLVRPLFIYSDADIMEGKPQVAAFINFYLRRVKYYITDVGYFLPDEAAFRETIGRFPR